jgi:hypothetical protein
MYCYKAKGLYSDYKVMRFLRSSTATSYFWASELGWANHQTLHSESKKSKINLICDLELQGSLVDQVARFFSHPSCNVLWSSELQGSLVIRVARFFSRPSCKDSAG